MSRSPVKIHVTPNLVAPAPALTSSVDYKSEQAPVTAPSEADASNSLKNRTSASDERPPLMASLPARREASDEQRADWSREDDPDVVVRPGKPATHAARWTASTQQGL